MLMTPNNERIPTHTDYTESQVALPSTTTDTPQLQLMRSRNGSRYHLVTGPSNKVHTQLARESLSSHIIGGHEQDLGTTGRRRRRGVIRAAGASSGRLGL